MGKTGSPTSSRPVPPHAASEASRPQRSETITLATSTVQVSEQVDALIAHLLPALRRAAHVLQTRRVQQLATW